MKFFLKSILGLSVVCCLGGCMSTAEKQMVEPAAEQPPASAQDNAVKEDTVKEEGMKEEIKKEDGFIVDEFKTQTGKVLKFYAIKHGSLRILFDNLEIEVDPVIDLDGVKTDYSKLPKADYIFVTHEHYDHYDANAIEALSKSDTQIITNHNVFGMLGKGIEMKNGDTREIRPDFKIEAVPAYNTTAGRDKFHPKGRDNGFILTLDGFRVYIGADTEDIPEMKDIQSIDVAFLPCNQPYTMTPEQLDRAARIIRPKVLFPYHYGATDMGKVTELLKDSGLDVRIRPYQ